MTVASSSRTYASRRYARSVSIGLILHVPRHHGTVRSNLRAAHPSQWRNCMARKSGRRLHVVAALMVVALVVAACSSDKKSSTGAGSGSGSSSASSSSGECKPAEALNATTTTVAGATTTTTAPTTTIKPPEKGSLEGLRGTTPLVDLGSDFKKVLECQGLDLKKTYNYGAESYDATVVIALAAELAKSDGIDLAKQINGVTRNGTKCKSFTECEDLIKKGTTDIDYDGVSG